MDEVMKVGVLNYFKTVIKEKAEIESQEGDVFKGVAIRAGERFATARTFSELLGLRKEFQEMEKKAIQEFEEKKSLAG